MQRELTDDEFDRLVLRAQRGRMTASVTRAVEVAHARAARGIEQTFQRAARLIGQVVSYGYQHRALGKSAPKYTRFTDDEVIATEITEAGAAGE